jgi:hypothetical protein
VPQFQLRIARRTNAQQFELAHTTRTEVPAEIEWKWPSDIDSDWKPTEDPDNPTSAEGLAKLMVHLWTADCSPEPTATQDKKKQKKKSKKDQEDKKKNINYKVPRVSIQWKDREDTLPMSNISRTNQPWPWTQCPISIKIFFPDREAPKTTMVSEIEQHAEQGIDKDLDWLSTASMEVDFGHNLAEPCFIYNRAPKKLHTPLKLDAHGRSPPIGWAIWIDEDFTVPWYIPLVLIVLSLIVFIFAVCWTSEQTPKANGYTIGSFLLTPVTLVFGAWVLKAKDSRHARL